MWREARGRAEGAVLALFTLRQAEGAQRGGELSPVAQSLRAQSEAAAAAEAAALAALAAVEGQVARRKELDREESLVDLMLTELCCAHKVDRNQN